MDDAAQWQHWSVDLYPVSMSLVAVTRAIFAIQYRARWIKRCPQRTPVNAVSEGCAIAANFGGRLQFRYLTVEFVRQNIVRVQRQYPLRLDLLQTEVALPCERIELALHHSHLRIRLHNLQCLVGAETVQH